MIDDKDLLRMVRITAETLVEDAVDAVHGDQDWTGQAINVLGKAGGPRVTVEVRLEVECCPDDQAAAEALQ